MNAIELLKKDHETVDDLFESFEKAQSAETESEKQRIAAKICEELEAHALVEEELFYPAVEARAEQDEEAEEGVKEAHEEHALVKMLVAELKEMSSDDGQFDAKVKVLKDLVEHHVEEEEGTLMPRAKKLLSDEELEELGARVEQRRQEHREEPASARPRQKSARARRAGDSGSQRSRRASSRSSASARSARSPRPSRRRSSGGRRRAKR
jgi:hemerythrin superfamily protein